MLFLFIQNKTKNFFYSINKNSISCKLKEKARKCSIVDEATTISKASTNSAFRKASLSIKTNENECFGVSTPVNTPIIVANSSTSILNNKKSTTSQTSLSNTTAASSSSALNWQHYFNTKSNSSTSKSEKQSVNRKKKKLKI